MDSPAGNVAVVSHVISPRACVCRERHFTIQNNVRRQSCVRVIRIAGAGAVVPHEDVRKTFSSQLLAMRGFILRTHFVCAKYIKGDARQRELGGLRAERGGVPPASIALSPREIRAGLVFNPPEEVEAVLAFCGGRGDLGRLHRFESHSPRGLGRARRPAPPAEYSSSG